MDKQDEVQKLVEWVAIFVYKSMFPRQDLYEQRPWEVVGEEEREVYRADARAILSHPDLALIDREKKPPSSGVLDSLLKETWELCQQAMLSSDYLPVIPLAEELKEKDESQTRV